MYYTQDLIHAYYAHISILNSSMPPATRGDRKSPRGGGADMAVEHAVVITCPVIEHTVVLCENIFTEFATS
jgi:hypothetical protein